MNQFLVTGKLPSKLCGTVGRSYQIILMMYNLIKLDLGSDMIPSTYRFFVSLGGIINNENFFEISNEEY